MSEETTGDYAGIETRAFEVEYVEIDESEMRDVSFTISERAETILFRQIGELLHQSVEDGIFDAHTVHMYRQLCDQNKFPPWFSMGERTYDLQMNRSDYQLFSKLISMSLENIVTPDDTEPYIELVGIWMDVTEQMKGNVDTDDEPIEKVDTIHIDDGSEFDVFENKRTGDTWFQCTDCTVSYGEIGDEHECAEFLHDE